MTVSAPTAFNDRSSTLRLLLSRRSGKARDLVAPGPDDAELRQILTCASRVPDHGKLAPWRFVVVPKATRAAFGEALVAVLKAENPQATPVLIDNTRAFAHQAPVLVAVLSRVKRDHPIPAWEQELSAGAACQNLLLAAHALGYRGNWLTEWPAFSEGVVRLLGGEPGDRIAGFIFLGSSDKPLEERPRPDYDAVVSTWAPACDL
ncbi:nitroreductase family protein [Parapedomonas caeni]